MTSFMHDPEKTRVMGVINITPDSFFDGGKYTDQYNIEKHISKLISDGADIIDIGCESSRPGSKPVTVEEEIRRITLTFPFISKNHDIQYSVDTYKPEIAKIALDNGFTLINDITGGNEIMYQLIGDYNAGVVIMHMKGIPETMQINPVYDNIIEEINNYFEDHIQLAIKSGISDSKIILDPGIGFGKNRNDNYVILNCLGSFRHFQIPIMVGTSRKSFLTIDADSPADRISGSIVSSIIALQNGAEIIRVHDVKQIKKSVKILKRFHRNTGNAN